MGILPSNIIFHQREKDRHCFHSTIIFSLYFYFSIFNYISGYGLHFLIIYLKIRGTEHNQKVKNVKGALDMKQKVIHPRKRL